MNETKLMEAQIDKTKAVTALLTSLRDLVNDVRDLVKVAAQEKSR